MKLNSPHYIYSLFYLLNPFLNDSKIDSFLLNFCNCSYNDFSLLESFVGILTSTLTIWSPYPFPLKSLTPLPFNLKVVPDCVPAGILTFTSPCTVGTSTSHPKVASTELIGIVT